MDKKSNLILNLIPKYALIPIIVYLIGIPLYFLGHIFAQGFHHYDISLTIDDLIPFVPAFIWIYVLAYFQWFIGYFFLARSSESLCKKYFGGEIVSKLICFMIFLLLPTTMVRPELSGLESDGLTMALIKWMYSIDSPDNLFPSIHCLESWLVARGLLESNAPKPAKVLMCILSVLVFASVVLVKQHLFVDIIGGIAVTEIGLLLAEKLKIFKFYNAIEKAVGLR